MAVRSRVSIRCSIDGLSPALARRLTAQISLALGRIAGHPQSMGHEPAASSRGAPSSAAPIPDGAVVARLQPSEADFRNVLARFKRAQVHKGNAERHVDQCVRWLAAQGERFGWARYSDVKPEHCRAIIDGMVDAGLEPRTRNTRRSYLNTLLRYWRAELEASDAMMKLADPLRMVPSAKIIEKDATYTPTQEEVVALIGATKARARQKRDRWVCYLVAACTGVRHGVCKKLRWEHVHESMDPPFLKLPAWIMKNRRRSVVWLTREAAAALAELRRRRSPLPDEIVFESVPKAHSFDSDLRAAKLVKDRGDAGSFCFRSLRHFASNRMEWQKPFTLAERQRQNTHETSAMTARTYTKPDHAELGRKIALMPSLLAENGGAQEPTGPPVARDGGKIPEPELILSGDEADYSGSDAHEHQHRQLGHAKERDCRSCASLPRDRGSLSSRDRVFRAASAGQRLSGRKNRASGSNPVALILSLDRFLRVVERLLDLAESAGGGLEGLPDAGSQAKHGQGVGSQDAWVANRAVGGGGAKAGDSANSARGASGDGAAEVGGEGRARRRRRSDAR